MSPPRTPTRSSHRRHPSSLDMGHTRQSLRRRSSGYSPITPRSSREFDHGSPSPALAGDSGLGNLADELGDVWDDDDEAIDGEYDEGDMTQEDIDGMGVSVEHYGSVGLVSSPIMNGVRDSGVSMESDTPQSKLMLSPGMAKQGGRRHQRQRSLYDGSDYGGEEDLERGDIPAGLERQMAAIEGLVRRGLEENGSSSDEVVKRVLEQLRDLGSQTSIETGATRLKTAHDALATHLAHQSRTLTSLTASFTGPRAIYLDPESIETLLPLITSTLELLPHPSEDAVYTLAQLAGSTRELLYHLSNVSDSLHMSRQVQNDATRRLRVAKEQVSDWKKDAELREQGMAYIEKGEWDRRLEEREAKRACSAVVDGFEEVCEGWRKRLCEGLGVASA
ncbi:hypothetical protein M011DRAFT_463466 [Sporormia fimetaria CBS 119925]|uniref:Uncharacterized protein n=1 Tax=Sporormia fimetaria CBS 119925 TaxID=1340428 RepID=A0A6A6VRW9_9PLEO|nr:hypothetical protein M011DRAFT_463466 [Sporormia fimetaria CBS 119925]